MMKNKKVKRMISSIYGVDFDFWENKKISDKLREELECDCGFFVYHLESRITHTVSLTADQLRGK